MNQFTTTIRSPMSGSGPETKGEPPGHFNPSFMGDRSDNDGNEQTPVMRPAHLGFTLIELLITVALVSILAAIAVPSYQSHLRKSTRSEAQSFMMAVAARQQQFLVDTRSYAATVTAVGIPVPAKVAAAYAVNMPAPTPAGFTLTLTPTGGQVNEPCGTLSINQVGTKTAAKSGCW